MHGTGTHATAQASGEAPLHDLMHDVGQQDHVCLVYESREEQFAAVIPYIKDGLEAGEQCLYVTDENTGAAVADAMRAHGVDVDAAVEAGDLRITDTRETYLRNGRFDPDWMIHFLGEATQAAEDAGYTGLRITGEMTWALGDGIGADRVLEYEAKLNAFFAGAKASAICQYNRRRFEPGVIKGVLETHPRVVYEGIVCRNLYYVPPEEFLGPDREDKEIERLLSNILTRERVENEVRELNAELRERVRDRTAALERANEELESFAYSVSHDLRAPLRGIEVMSRALDEDYGERMDEDGRAILGRIHGESHRMTRLVNDLLTLATVARGDLNREPVNVTALAGDVVARLREAEPERDVHVTVADGLTAHADARLLRVALENLVGNAWKYTARTPDARIDIGQAGVDGERALVVSDNGVGFDPAKADRLFTPFKRLHTQSEFEGTGVGLATVHRIVKRHGGHVWAEGASGKGATFRFTLGRADAVAR